jgi:hypothetical protein
MSVLKAPATVTITNQTGVATLTAVRAMIGVPSARDQQVHGGIIRYAVLIDPLTALSNASATVAATLVINVLLNI